MFKRIEAFSNPKQLVGIQYLRAVAVLAVVSDHASRLARLPRYFGEKLNVYNRVIEAGAVGVDLFFVISGFIIFYVSLNNTSLTPKVSAHDFFKQRFTRLIPFLWFAIISYCLYKVLSGGRFLPIRYLKSLMLFPVGKLEPIILWTLRHEVIFYILFGIFVIHLKRNWIWLLPWFLAPFIWFGLGFHEHSATSWLGLFTVLFGKHNINFGIGCFTGYLFKKGYLNFAIETRFGFLLALIAVIPLIIIGHVVGMGSFAQILLCGIVSGFVVFGGISLESVKLTIFDHFGLLLGNASYSIYLIHFLIQTIILKNWSGYETNPDPSLIMLAGTIIPLGVGILIYWLVEKPLIKFVKSRMGPGRVVTIQAS